MGEVIVDTNVPMVANGQAGQASDACVEASIDRLIQIRAGDVVLLDGDGLIFEEYSRYLSHGGQPGVGDAFFKWLWDNQAVEAHCRRVPITPTEEPRRFLEFPDDARLATFDPNDRKFVAVALAAGSQPVVVNASGTDWWEARVVLTEYGIAIEFVCPALMQA